MTVTENATGPTWVVTSETSTQYTPAARFPTSCGEVPAGVTRYEPVGMTQTSFVGDPARLSTLVAERDRLDGFLSDPHLGALHVNRRMDRLRRDAAIPVT